MIALHLLFAVLLLSIDATSSPVLGRRFALRGLRQRPMASSSQVFDSAFVEKELIGVLTKYQNASEYLAGIDLTPLPSIPLADNYPYFQDPGSVSPNITNHSVLGKDENRTLTNGPVLSAGPLDVNPQAAVMPLTDYISGGLDTLYYGSLEIGTPSQELTVDIDTGSADLWVPSNCRNCLGAQFDATKSLTYKDQAEAFSVAYASGNAEGKLVQDSVTLGGLSVKNQIFGAIILESDEFSDYPNDGLLGLAFSSIATSHAPTFMENLMKDEQVFAPFFSVHLARDRATGSELCIGCYNSLRANGSVTWLPVESKTYWSVKMDGIQVDSNSSFQTDLIAAVDTGTTLIYLPEDIAEAFYELIPGAQPTEEFGTGFYTYPCSSNLNVSFSLGGHRFVINQDDFNLGMADTDSGDCVGGVLALGDGFPSNLAILGDEFLKSWYSIYDYSNGARVGLAPSINNT